MKLFSRRKQFNLKPTKQTKADNELILFILSYKRCYLVPNQIFSAKNKYAKWIWAKDTVYNNNNNNNEKIDYLFKALEINDI